MSRRKHSGAAPASGSFFRPWHDLENGGFAFDHFAGDDDLFDLFSDGRWYIDSSRISSRIIIRPRAPTFRLWASWAMACQGPVGEFERDIIELKFTLILLDQTRSWAR